MLDCQEFCVNEKYKPVKRETFDGPVIMASCQQPGEHDEEFLRRLNHIVFIYHDMYECPGCDLDEELIGLDMNTTQESTNDLGKYLDRVASSQQQQQLSQVQPMNPREDDEDIDDEYDDFSDEAEDDKPE